MFVTVHVVGLHLVLTKINGIGDTIKCSVWIHFLGVVNDKGLESESGIVNCIGTHTLVHVLG